MTLAEMKRKRASLFDEARKLLDTADNEKRDLTKEERTEYDILSEQIEDLNRKIDLKNKESILNKRDIAPIYPSVPGEDSNDELYAETRSGEKIRLYRSGERWSNSDNSALSLGRYIRGVWSGDWRGAEREYEELRAIKSEPGMSGGIFVTGELASKVIEDVRNKAKVVKAGALSFSMGSAETTFVKISDYPDVSWTPEAEEISETDMSFTPLTLKAAKLASIVRVPLELVEDAPNFSNVVESALIDSMALEIDRCALYGHGVGQPLGLLSYKDIGNTDISSPAANALMGHLVDGYYNLLDNNIEASEISMMYNSTFGKQLSKMVDGAGSYISGSNAPDVYRDSRRFMTNQIQDVVDGNVITSPVCLGRFSDLVMGIKSDMKIEVSREEYESFKKNMLAIRITWRGDIQPMNSRSFHILNVSSSS